MCRRFCDKLQPSTQWRMPSRRQLLIVTSKDDPHSDHVIARLNQIGRDESVVRLNTEDFAANCVYWISEKGFEFRLRDSGKVFTHETVKSVWYRRPEKIRPVDHQDEGVRDFCRMQHDAALRGLYFISHVYARWVNPLPSLHRARNKLQQLDCAARLGILTPRTVVTNDASVARRFLDTVSAVCIKSLDQPNFRYVGRLYPFYTRIISARDIDDDPGSVELAPVIFQEYIGKLSDVRVTVFGERIVAVKIHSQDNEFSKVDFRGAAPHLLKHEVINLAEETERGIRAFMADQKLVFAAFDFVEDKDGDLVFVECNPNGQWLWVEKLAAVDLTGLLLECLGFESNDPVDSTVAATSS